MKCLLLILALVAIALEASADIRKPGPLINRPPPPRQPPYRFRRDISPHKFLIHRPTPPPIYKKEPSSQIYINRIPPPPPHSTIHRFRREPSPQKYVNRLPPPPPPPRFRF